MQWCDEFYVKKTGHDQVESVESVANIVETVSSRTVSSPY